MAKTKHFKTVIFTEDFAIHKKDAEFTCDSMLASSLVRERKVAVFKDQPEETQVKKPAIVKTKNTKKK